MYLMLFTASGAAFVWALQVAGRNALVLGAGVLAFGLGLRHALDADHIAAIDNVTRRLMRSGRRPVGVGLFFSLGHASVVVLATLGAGLAASAFRRQLSALQHFGGVIGVLISSLFLLIVAAMNIAVVLAIWRTLQHGRSLGPEAAVAVGDPTPLAAGPVSTLLGPLLRGLSRSWMMFPIGFLFGLGFDTATEIGLLSLSAVESAKGLPLLSIMVFPALFTAAMALVDTTDSLVMLGVYGWAARRPASKLYYNLAVTAASVVIAVVIGTVQLLQLAGAPMGRSWISSLSTFLEAHSDVAGAGVALAFLTIWIAFASVSWMRRRAAH